MKILVNIVRVILLLTAIFFIVILLLCLVHFLLHGESQSVNKILLKDLLIISTIATISWAIAHTAAKAL